MTANIQFSAGTDASKVDNFLQHLDTTLRETNDDLGATWSSWLCKNMVRAAHPVTAAGQHGR